MEPEGVSTNPVEASQPPVKKLQISKWQIVAAALIVIVAWQSFFYLSLSSNYNTLSAEHDSLTDQYSTMQSNYDAMESELNAMHSSYDPLQANYSSLQSSYRSLQDDYNSLQLDLSHLQSTYDSYVSSYSSLRNRINNRFSESDVKSFITPSEPSVQSKVQEITGGWSDTSNWNEYWSDLKLLYDWVVSNIEYRSDGLFPEIPSTPSGSLQYNQEMWQLPKETLELSQGDCEDMAILLTSMIRSYNGREYGTECIAITGSTGAHVAVQIPVAGDRLTILDPAGNYYTQNAYGTLDSEYVTMEINDWLNYWKPDLSSDVHVDRVFSDSIDNSFSSTSAYITWMNNR